MPWNPYLNFDGDCEEAFHFYERVLGGKIIAMTRYGETPAGEYVSATAHNKILHACLKAGEQTLMGGDATPEHPYEGIKGCSIALQVDSPAESDRVFEALAEGGTVTMPLQETFWAVRFGMLTDRFGVPWLINCEKAA